MTSRQRPTSLQLALALAVALAVALVPGGATALRAQGGAVPVPAASSKGFIWTIQKAGRTGWLVGSLHLLPPDAYPLPASMEAAFKAAEVLVEEADPDELSAPATAAEVVKRAFYPPGQTLEGHVSAATFRTLSDRAAQAGVPAQVLQQMRPWMVAVTLAGLEMQKSGFDPALGLDRHFRERARQTSKPLRTVETALEQIGMLESLGPALQDALVVETLRGASSEIDQARALFTAWRNGDASTMEKILVEGTRASPDIYKVLFVERNRRWMPTIEACLDASRCMIVVGAGHLVGADGLIALLRARGYTVEQG